MNRDEQGIPKRPDPAQHSIIQAAVDKIPAEEQQTALPIIWTIATKKPRRPEADRLKRLATIAAIKGNSDTGEPSGNSDKEEEKK